MLIPAWFGLELQQSPLPISPRRPSTIGSALYPTTDTPVEPADRGPPNCRAACPPKLDSPDKASRCAGAHPSRSVPRPTQDSVSCLVHRLPCQSGIPSSRHLHPPSSSTTASDPSIASSPTTLSRYPPPTHNGRNQRRRSSATADTAMSIQGRKDAGRGVLLGRQGVRPH